MGARQESAWIHAFTVLVRNRLWPRTWRFFIALKCRGRRSTQPKVPPSADSWCTVLAKGPFRRLCGRLRMRKGLNHGHWFHVDAARFIPRARTKLSGVSRRPVKPARLGIPMPTSQTLPPSCHCSGGGIVLSLRREIPSRPQLGPNSSSARGIQTQQNSLALP